MRNPRPGRAGRASVIGVALHSQALIEEAAGTGDVRLTPLVSATIQ